MGNKGGQFEREICKLLSRWWTGGKRDDVFWRTAGSGARATSRSKTQKQTFGQYGDIQATDPIGQPLLDLFTIECKTGYGKASLMDLLDGTQDAHGKYKKFILQAREERRQAKTRCWMMIARRHKKKRMIYMPVEACTRLANASTDSRVQRKDLNAGLFHVTISGKHLFLIAMSLQDFFETVTPHGIRSLHSREFGQCKRRRNTQYSRPEIRTASPSR